MAKKGWQYANECDTDRLSRQTLSVQEHCLHQRAGLCSHQVNKHCPCQVYRTPCISDEIRHSIKYTDIVSIRQTNTVHFKQVQITDLFSKICLSWSSELHYVVCIILSPSTQTHTHTHTFTQMYMHMYTPLHPPLFLIPVLIMNSVHELAPRYHKKKDSKVKQASKQRKKCETKRKLQQKRERAWITAQVHEQNKHVFSQY